MNVKLACPKCGKALELALADMSAGKAMACPGCGEVIRFRGADTESVQHAIDALQAKLGPGVNVKVDVKVGSVRPWWKFWGA